MSPWTTEAAVSGRHSLMRIKTGSLGSPAPALVTATTCTLYSISGTRSSTSTWRTSPVTLWFNCIWSPDTFPTHHTCTGYQSDTKYHAEHSANYFVLSVEVHCWTFTKWDTILKSLVKATGSHPVLQNGLILDIGKRRLPGHLHCGAVIQLDHTDSLRGAT